MRYLNNFSRRKKTLIIMNHRAAVVIPHCNGRRMSWWLATLMSSPVPAPCAHRA